MSPELIEARQRFESSLRQAYWFFRRYREKIPNQADVDDYKQSLLLALWRAALDWREDRAVSFNTCAFAYLHTDTRTFFRNRVRRFEREKARRLEYELSGDTVDVDPSPGPADLAEAADYREWAKVAVVDPMAELASNYPSYHSAVECFYLKGMTQRSISQAAGVAESNVHMRIRRGLEKMRKYVKNAEIRESVSRC